MKPRNSVLIIQCICLLLLISINSNGQTTQEIDAKIEVSFAQRIGTTQPLHRFAHQPITNKIQRERKKRTKLVPNFPGRRKNDQTLYPAPPFGEDPVRQANLSRGLRSNTVPKIKRRRNKSKFRWCTRSRY